MDNRFGNNLRDSLFKSTDDSLCCSLALRSPGAAVWVEGQKMKLKAVALCRVSTPEQRQSNSLSRQEQSVSKAATELDVEVIRWWPGDVSSKVGRNVKRKDLVEIYEFCKGKRSVRYLIIDEVDRFMRSMAEMFYWIVEFQQIGVEVYFASNPELNGKDSRANLFLSLDAYKAEGSNEERQRKSINGHATAIREGRYTFPPKPGYIKGDLPGVHVPHPVWFKPFQQALKGVASRLYTPSEAHKRLNQRRIHIWWKVANENRQVP
jgi:DNA invertase Pin-like site-specific DNA recombinase